jgi:hypothetical protein
MRIATLYFLLPVAAMAQSAWLPPKGSVLVTLGYSNQSFQNIWRGAKPDRLSAPVRQQTMTVSVETGLSRTLAADATVGYTTNRSNAFGGPRSDGGRSDSSFGLRWKVLDEQRSDGRLTPTVSLRAGGIIEGSYRPGVPFSAGDGASGAEFSVLLGKAIGRTRFGAFGESGYRVRNQAVPADFYGSCGMYRVIGRATLTGVYRLTNGVSGPNIGDPGYTYPWVKERSRSAEAGIGWTDRRGRSVQFFTAWTLGGRNTGDLFVVGTSGSFFIGKR